MMPPWLEHFFEKIFGPSWRTALAGLAAFGAVCYTPVRAYFDGLPETVPDWNPVVGGFLVFLGLAKARDNVVTSAKVEAGPTGALK